MALRLGNDPDKRAHPFNFIGYGQLKAKYLLVIRDRVPRIEYPTAVVRELFVDMHSIMNAWKCLDECFANVMMQTDFAEAVEAACVIINPYVNSARESFGKQSLSEVKIGPFAFQGMLEMANMAARGDNSMVEELEYSYVCHSVVRPLWVHWAALGLMGVERCDAYLDLVDFTYKDPKTTEIEHQRNLERQKRGERWRNYQLYNFDDAFETFRMSASGSMSGGGIMQPAYNPLPPLW